MVFQGSRGKKLVHMALRNKKRDNYGRDKVDNNLNNVIQPSFENVFLKEAFDHEILLLDNESATIDRSLVLDEDIYFDCEKFTIVENETSIKHRRPSSPIRRHTTSSPTFNYIHGRSKLLVDYSDSSSESDDETRCNNENMGASSNIASSIDTTKSTSSSDSSTERGERCKRELSQKRLANKTKSLRLNYKTQKGESITVLPNPCKGKACRNTCNTFTSRERKELFQNFWAVGDSNARAAYINGCIKIVPVKRRRTLDISRRSCTLEHFFVRHYGTQAKVCQQFFIRTLGITQKIIRRAMSDKLKSLNDRGGVHPTKRKITVKQKSEVRSFMDRLPAVPSLHRRGSSAKLYLPSDIKTYSNLYRMYVNTATSKALNISGFRRILNTEYNLGIHVPRKDKCFECERYKILPSETKTELEEKSYVRHVKEKNEAECYFLDHQKSKLSDCVVSSFDLQKVLTTPHGSNMLTSLSRKYAYHNLTVCESGTANGYCYLWGERDGRRGANEVCSVVYAYLRHLDSSAKAKRVSFFCDDCPRRNKNEQMTTMLAYFVNKTSVNIKQITVTYLVSGHTYMPVDSMQAVIEKKIKTSYVQAPSEWATILRNAHSKTKPYEVNVLNYTSFLDWESVVLQKELKDAEGNEIGISDIKYFEIERGSASIKVKCSYEKDIPAVDVPFLFKHTVDVVPFAYTSELPINKKKYNDLTDLCRNLIEAQYHSQYFSLKTSEDVADTLPETDIEDTV